MNEAWIRAFTRSAGFILLVASLSRFLMAFGAASTLGLPDPALGFSIRHTVLMVAAVELLVAMICLFTKQIRFQIGWLTWLVTNYLAFRMWLFWMHCHPQGTCVGALTDPLYFSRGFYGWMTFSLSTYFIVGTYLALIFILAAPKRVEESSEVSPVGQSAFCKMSCVLCGGHIEFPAYAVGQKISCPHCAKTITLLNPSRPS